MSKKTEALVAEFKEAIAGENIDAFGECIEQLEKVRRANEPAGAELLEAVKQLSLMFTLHGELIKQWCDEEPEFRDMLVGFLEGIDQPIS